MDMPVLTPVPIRTRGKSFFARIWAWITEVRKWQVVENWEYDLDENTRVVVPKGFEFDGASIPRPLWAILSPTGLLLIQGLIHDYGYRYDYLWAINPDAVYGYEKIHVKAGRKFWDEVFYRVGREVNGMRVINGLAWLALASMGWLAWRANRKRNEEEVFPY